jgi:methionine biosynthesis protein metW
MRWNHNSVYYYELVADAAERGGLALDVGCGDGELLELLAGVCERVVGVEEDPVAARAAADRVAGSGTVICGDFMAAKSLSLAGFDTITCVACLQHLPLEAALAQMAELLRPGGRLLVIGLSANKSLVDWLLSALMIVPGRVSGWIHRESTFPGMRVAWPCESLDEIRSIANILLPGARIRRRLYWRYSLMWTKPAT